MGYYTDYTLEVINDARHDLVGDKSTEVDEVIEWMKKAGEEEKISNYAGSYDDLSSAMNAKWYDHHEDMRKVSLAFPHLLLRLSGTGEEEGDYWHAYYHAGKCQECPGVMEIKYPEFDPTQLK